MPYDNLLFEVAENIATITVNRPQVLNALNDATVAELEAAFREAGERADVRGVILTGAGEKAFVAGADISQFLEMDAMAGRESSLTGQRVLNTIEHLPKPVIAAVNGYALGGGCELALSCHIRIASENAKLGLPEVNLGLIPGYGGTQRLPRLVGKGKALEMILTGALLEAQEAYRIGLVNKVVPQKELLWHSQEMLRTIFGKGPIAIRLALEAVNWGLNVSLIEGLHLEATLFGMAASTEDMKEGAKAFLEKRKPAFRGK